MLKKIFTNDNFFKGMVVASIFCVFVYLINFIVSGADIELFGLSWTISNVLLGVCTAVLYISYQKHNKNVMKGMIGLLFGILLMNDIQSVEMYMSSPSDTIYNVIYVILDLVLITNHFIINSVHKSRPENIAVNQIVLLAQAILLIACYGNFFANIGSASLFESLAFIAEAFLFEFVFASIVCVESRLDAYRLDREENGWTEEEGYPEGYIHQKDR